MQLSDEERLQRMKEITHDGRHMTLTDEEIAQVMELIPEPERSKIQHIIDDWRREKK